METTDKDFLQALQVRPAIGAVSGGVIGSGLGPLGALVGAIVGISAVFVSVYIQKEHSKKEEDNVGGTQQKRGKQTEKVSY